MLKSIFEYLIILSIGVYIFGLYIQSKLLWLIHERFVVLTLAMATVAIIVGLIGTTKVLMSKNFKIEDDFKTHIVGLCFVILLILPILNLTPLNSKVLAVRTDTNTVFELPNKSNFARSSEFMNIKDWVVSFGTAKDLSQFDGQQVKLSGFVYLDERKNENLFLLSRFVVSCCAIDATPIGIYAEGADRVTQDKWYQIEGKFKVKKSGEDEYVVIVIDKLEEIAVPERAYLY